MKNATERNSNWLYLFALIVLFLIVGGVLRTDLVHLPGHSVLSATKVSVQVAKDAAPVGLGEFKNGFASVLSAVLPAVVNISSTKIVKNQNVPGFLNDPLFRQFFGDQFPRPGGTEREQGLGSGVIVNADGYVLTNNHVVADASDVEVFTQGRRKFKANVIGTDPRTDIAVIKIDASGLPTLTLADSSKLKVGDVVFAIGQPFGIGETATMGIVSATGRGLGGAIEHYEDFIQTDAAINPGNSGGAMVDLRGHLVGINTAIISGAGGGNQGVGFAIPINLAHGVMDQIVEHGKVIRGYLGVSIQGVDPDMAKAFGLSHGGGALIGDVSPDGPGAKAGMHRGDIVLELNGQGVTGPEDLSVRISQTTPGSVVHLKIFREGQKRDLQATLAEAPEQASTSQKEAQIPTALGGIQVQDLTPAIARQLKLPSSETGVVVTGLDPSSAAAAGIREGDVIQEVNRRPVRNVEQFRHELAASANQAVLLLVNRSGTTHFVVIEQ